MAQKNAKRPPNTDVSYREPTNARVYGTVCWDDTLRGVGSVEVVARAGARSAKAVTTKKGWFTLALDGKADGCAEIRLTALAGARVLSEASFPLDERSRLEVGLLVPGALREVEKVSKHRVVTLARLPVDAERLNKLEPSELIEAVRRMVHGKSLEDKVAGLQPLVRGVDLAHLVNQSLSARPFYDLVEAIALYRKFPREVLLEIDAIRRMSDTRGFGFSSHDCGNFLITFDTTGAAAVPSSTASEDVVDPGSNPPVTLATLPAGGDPTYIKRICFWLERALAAYTSAPFSMRNPAASGKIPVVVNTDPYGSASSSGTFYINNNLNAEILCAVSVHELFHMVQYEYALGGAWNYSIIEGGAVFAEDASADSLNRYLAEANSATWSGTGLFVNPAQSLSSAGYDAAIFWRYIAEQQSSDLTEPYVGVETYRALVETCEAGGGCTTANLKTAIGNLPWYQDFYEFGYTDSSKTDLTSSETTFGNFVLACTLKDLGANVPDSRFDFLEDEESIGFDEVLNAVSAGAIETMTNLGSPAVTGSGTVTASTSLNWSGSVPSFGSRYYEATIDAAVTNVAVQFTAGSGLTSCLCQIVLVDATAAVRDLHRSDRTSYSKRICNDRGGVKLTKLIIAVSGCETPGPFTLTVTSAAPAPDVMVTRWHHLPRTEYEIDSKWWAWTWVSPDVWVDNDGNGLADSEVFFDFDNQLNIQLHNKGNVDATGVSVEFYYCDAAAAFGTWLPVRDKAGTIQTLSGLSVPQSSSATFVVPWSPAPSGASHHFCIRAIVTSSGDPNTDNKRVLSNFGNVIVKPSPFALDLSLVRRNPFDRIGPISLDVVPRLPPEYELALRDLKEQQVVMLEAGEERVDQLRVIHVPALANSKPTPTPPPTRRARKKGPKQEDGCVKPLVRLEKRPDPRGYYPTDPRALPPGLAGVPMVTVVHRGGGRVLGGVSFALRSKAATKPR